MVIAGSVLVVMQVEGSAAAPAKVLVRRARSIKVDDDFMFEEEKWLQGEMMTGK